VASDRPWMLVLGNEETGLRRLTLEKCDVVCSIPSTGSIGSLNVSVAAGILIQKLTSQ
jgi:23S rRNA (guanosine2251-2'-O)-methyltransferase